MTGFANVSTPLWYITAAGVLILFVAAVAFTPHRHRCCGLLWTTEQLDWHMKVAHHNE